MKSQVYHGYDTDGYGGSDAMYLVNSNGHSDGASPNSSSQFSTDGRELISRTQKQHTTQNVRFFYTKHLLLPFRIIDSVAMFVF